MFISFRNLVRTAGLQACRRAKRHKRQSGRRPESLFPSICNPPQRSTRLAIKSFPFNMQSPSVFYPFGQKIFSLQYAIPLSVPPVWPENLFPSICNPPQCSTCLAIKSVPFNMQSPSVFHPFGHIFISRQSAVLVSVPTFFYSLPGHRYRTS
jgi:hypothetical protein